MSLKTDKALADVAKKAVEMSLRERIPKCDYVKGFTLIELLVVIAIIALLIARLTALPRCSKTISVYSVDRLCNVALRQEFMPLAKCTGKLAFTNSHKLPAECLLMWTHSQNLVFLLTNRVSSQRVREIGTSWLGQIRGVKRWNHEMGKRIVQIRSLNS